MFKFVKKAFFLGLTILSDFVKANSLLKCISMKNQECKARLKIINVNSNELVLYPFSIKTSKCGGSCNNVNDPYAKICVPDVVRLKKGVMKLLILLLLL